MDKSPDPTVAPPAEGAGSPPKAVAPTSIDTSPGTAPEVDLTETQRAPSAGGATEAYAGTHPAGDTEPMTTRSAAAAPGPVPKVTALGDYRLVRRLGAGGMGSVFLARQVDLDRDVALKVLSRELAAKSGFVERFRREARLMARLDHPNIVHCYGVGEDHGWHYLAMEYVDGGSLARWLKKLGRLSVGDALHVALACASALQHAHEQRLIHRDVKPDNVLLSTKGAVKLVDLGLAKALDDDLNVTKTGTGAGTPLYMAPEQARDLKRVDHRCDLYALGCVLYRCLAGKPPYQCETMMEVLEAKEAGKFTPAHRLNPDVPLRLDLIIDKLLAPRPEHRHQSCAELIKDLTALGLAHATPEFIVPASETRAAPARPAPTRPPRPAAKAAPLPPAPPHAARKAAPPPETEEVDFWYVTYTNFESRVVTQKLTTGQVINLIGSGQFDPNTQASRTLGGGFRGVGTYHEFARYVRGRTARESADRKATTFRNLYEQIEKDRESREKWRWFRRLTGGLVNWASVLICLAILIVGTGLILLLIRVLCQWLGAKLDSL